MWRSTSGCQSGNERSIRSGFPTPACLWLVGTDWNWKKKEENISSFLKWSQQTIFNYQPIELKQGTPVGTTEVESRASRIRSGRWFSMWTQGLVVSSRLPLGRGWRFGHDHRIPVIRDLWQTRGQGLLPCLHEAIHTKTWQSIKRNIPRLKNVIWSLQSFPKREKVQSKFSLWKMKKPLPRKKYYQGENLTDWRQKKVGWIAD